MRLFDTYNWQEIWVTITRNKTRSLLTAFGVSWGIFMLVILLGAGSTFRESALGNIEGIEVSSCYFMSRPTSEPYKGHKKYRHWNFNNKDIELMRSRVRSVDIIAPVLHRNTDAVYGNKKGSYTAISINNEHYKLEKFISVKGRLLAESDDNSYRKVCVIGERIYDALFDIGEDPVGKFIRISGIYFQIVGVIRPVSENLSVTSYPPNTIYIPFNTMQRTFNFGNLISLIGCTPAPGYRSEIVIEEVAGIIKENHQIAPSDNNAIYAADLEKEFSMINNIFSGIDIFVWIVGLGALFSGVIGISNIMLVTVRERMREIGIRRALGAKPWMILGQIMSESFVLTALAGIIGMTFGIWTLDLAGIVISASGDEMGLVAPGIPFGTAMAAMAILVVSGILAGVIPAMMATRIKAIDAIRDE